MTSAELATPIQTPLMMPHELRARRRCRHTWRYLPGDRQAGHLAGEDQRERGREVRQEVRELRALEAEAERGVVGERDQREVEQDLVHAVLVGHLGDERRRDALGFDRVRLDVAEHDADAGEQDEVERDQDGGVADVGVLQAEGDERPRAPRARRAPGPRAARRCRARRGGARGDRGRRASGCARPCAA